MKITALDTAKKELNEKALKDFRKQDQGVFHLFPRAAPSPCQLVLFSKVFRGASMKNINRRGQWVDSVKEKTIRPVQKKKKTKTYQQKLLDPRWQKKRLEILQRDDWACQKCGDKESTLHVHHRVYWPDSDPWDIDERYLVALCEACHEKESGLLSEIRISMKAAVERVFFADEIVHIMKGFRDINVQKNPKHTAKIIRYALSSREAMSALEKMYTECRDQ